MMPIEVIEELALSHHDDRQIAALLKRSFDTDFGNRSYFVQPHQRRYVMRKGSIVGHIGISLRLIRAGQDLVTTLCVGDVAADPDYRGRGIASALLKTVIADAEQTSAEVIMLFGDAGLYAGHGFQPAENPLRFVDLDGHRTNSISEKSDPSLMVMPLGPARWDGACEVDLLGFKF